MRCFAAVADGIWMPVDPRVKPRVRIVIASVVVQEILEAGVAKHAVSFHYIYH